MIRLYSDKSHHRYIIWLYNLFYNKTNCTIMLQDTADKTQVMACSATLYIIILSIILLHYRALVYYLLLS